MDKLIKKLESDRIEINKWMGVREKDRCIVINEYIDKLIKWAKGE